MPEWMGAILTTKNWKDPVELQTSVYVRNSSFTDMMQPPEFISPTTGCTRSTINTIPVGVCALT